MTTLNPALSSEDTSLEALVARRVALLTDYQNAAYAQRYARLVERVAERERTLGGDTPLAEAVARYYYKLLAYKDEYEIARLLTDPAFERRIAAQFEDGYTLRYHLAPPMLARTDQFIIIFCLYMTPSIEIRS